MKALQSLALAKKYTSDTAEALGAVKGAPCEIQSITYDPILGATTIVYSWTSTSGQVETESAVIHDGKDGKDGADGKDGKDGAKGAKGDTGTSISGFDTEGTTLIIELSDGTTSRVDIPTVGIDALSELEDVDLTGLSDGKVLVWDALNEKWVPGQGGSGTSDYPDLTNKPQIEGVTLSGNKTASDLGLAKSSDIPTDTSDLTNTAGFITKVVDDLVNYYLKSETYTKTEVDNIVTAIKNSRFEAVQTLPTTGIKTNVIYLVPSSDPQTGDIKDEYINLDGSTAGWEKIGSTAVDLTGYVTTTDLNTALAAYTTTTDLTALLSGKQDKIQLSTMPTASVDSLGKVVQYIGATSALYTHGYFYECVSDGALTPTYSWVASKVQESDTIQMDTLPTASVDWLNRIVQFTGATPYTNGYFYKCVYNNGVYEWIEWAVMRVSGSTPMLVDVSGASITRNFRDVTITWTDPADSEISGQVVAEWGGTKVVRKVGSAPQNEEDGTLIVNSTTRDAYASTGYVDQGLEYGVVYYYRFFPYSTINVVTKGTSISVNCQREIIPIPTQTGTLTYNNTTQSPTLSNTAHFTTSGQTSGKDAGNYTMTCSLESDDYRWSDDSATDKSVTWSIQKAGATITPSKSNIEMGSKVNTYNVSFSDLYGRTIVSAVSSDSTKVTASTDGTSVSLSYQGLGTATVTVTTDSSLNANVGTCTLNVTCALQIIYGMQIDGDESDPSTMVTYLSDCDNYGYTPAHMDFQNDEFSYGSWSQSEFFMPKPCMLNYDGTVAYYLDPSDYTKKADGVTPSDVSDSSFQGNAMMEWGRDGRKIWYKVVPYNSGKSGKIYIANYKADNNYHDWSFHNCDGVSVDHFYTPIYNGSLVDGKLRSISGLGYLMNQSGTTEISYAKANNQTQKELWNIECMADRILINFLLILMGKSCNTQEVFGQGAASGSSEAANATFQSGVHNSKGLFYGTNTDSVSSYTFDNCVKVFGMENYWGLVWRRTNGYMYVSNNQKIKLTYGQEDGSGVDGYNTDGSNYISLGIGVGGTNGGYISRMKYTEHGMFAEQASGSASTYYSDGCWFNNGTMFALFGGDSVDSSRAGAAFVDLGGAVSHAGWNFGAAPSCKPLAS